MMFPGYGAEIYRNDAGEVLGWDSPSYDEPPDIEDYYDPRWDEYDEEEEDDDQSQ